MRVLAAFFTFFGVFIASAQVAAQPTKSAYDFVKGPTFRSLSLSPDGRFLAAARRAGTTDSIEELRRLRSQRRLSSNEARRLFAAELPNDEVVVFDLTLKRKPQIINTDNKYVRDISWANTERVLITLAVPITRRYWTYSGSVVLSIDVNTGAVATLLDNKKSVQKSTVHLSGIIQILPEDPDHVLMAASNKGFYDLWKVNVNNGDASLVERGRNDTFRWITDSKGKPAFRLDTNPNGTMMHAYANVSGDWKKVSSVRRRREVDEPPDFWPIGPGENAGEIYVRARLEGEDRSTIKVFDINEGEFTRTALTHPVNDIGGGLLDYATGQYLGGWYYDGRFRVAMADPSLQDHIDAINAFFDHDSNVFIENISIDSDIVLLRISGPKTPGEYYIYDYQNAKITPLFSAYPHLRNEDLSSVEIVEYAARDGKIIRGFVTHPLGNADIEAPLIVMPHGGPEARTTYGYYSLPQFLGNRGYRVFQPNFRGSTGYGQSFVEEGYGEWGGEMQDDVTDGVNWLIELGLARRKNICIVGASYGGYAALYGAMSSPELYGCAVATAAVSDLPEMLKHERESGGAKSSAYEYWVKSIGHPRKDREKLIEKSPARHPEKIQIPILIVHGDADLVVPIEQAELMMKALDDAGRSYEKLILEDSRHSFTRESARQEYFEAVDQFIGKHLSP